MIAVFYHCWWPGGAAHAIMAEQMATLRQCGLAEAADEISVGFQGSAAGSVVARGLMPHRAYLHHEEEKLGEIPTLMIACGVARANPDCKICYFHTKGASRGDATHRWRHCLESTVLHRWRECVAALDSHDTAGAHWIQNASGQCFWAGNFWWANARYLASLPMPTELRECNRWWAELWVSSESGNPKVADLSGHAFGACP